jgi:hypothetical protein
LREVYGELDSFKRRVVKVAKREFEINRQAHDLLRRSDSIPDSRQPSDRA